MVIEISKNNIKEIGKSLIRAGMLDTEPLAIYGSEKIPDDAVPMCSIDKCVVKGIIAAAFNEETPALYISKDTLKGCCPGAMSNLGFTKPMKYIKYFVSTGHEKFRDGEGEYLKACPEYVEESFEAIGEMNLSGKYLVIQKCKDFEEDVGVKAVLCFGKSEQIRNLGGLIHFRTKNPFNSIDMPFSAACATLVTYPVGIAENTPKETAFVGPVDPTVNVFFPEDYMGMGIPLGMAVKMHEDLEDSFIMKRPHVACPETRDKIMR